jgi:queuine tRNA-ribosyltransferase
MTELERDQEMRFEVLKAVLGEGAAARLGQLALPKRNRIETPNFLAVTSRGVVPHLTPDNVAKHGGFGGSYMALEDCKYTDTEGCFLYPAD